MNHLPQYLLPDTALVDANGRLSVGGVDLVDLAANHGTPLFVFDEAHLQARCQEAVQAFSPGVAYATKAFLCKEMATLAANAGMRLDVASGGELHVALSAGVDPSRLVMHGNNKSIAELTMAYEAGVGLVVVDSFDEINRLEHIYSTTRYSATRYSTRHSQAGGKPVFNCLVRVTPGIEAHTHEYVMTGQDDSKFGFGVANGQAQQAINRLRNSTATHLVGIHAHIGSQIFDTTAFEKEVEVLASLVLANNVEELCIGGGLGVPYVTGESSITITQWGAAAAKVAEAAGIPGNVALTAEPGRAIVATAGITLYEVGTIKDLPGIRTYLSVDGGMSDNPRPILYGSGYEAFLPRSTHAPRPRTVTIVGKHCESGDVLVRNAAIPADTAVGDIIATPVTGAYGHTMASNYNRVPRPPVIFVKDGNARVVVRRETYEDLIRLDI